MPAIIHTFRDGENEAMELSRLVVGSNNYLSVLWVIVRHVWSHWPMRRCSGSYQMRQEWLPCCMDCHIWSEAQSCVKSARSLPSYAFRVGGTLVGCEASDLTKRCAWKWPNNRVSTMGVGTVDRPRKPSDRVRRQTGSVSKLDARSHTPRVLSDIKFTGLSIIASCCLQKGMLVYPGA